MVAQNIDHDIFQEALQGLYDMVMLTDKSGQFRGDESIVVRGVEVAVQRETNRQRQIEALTATANPYDLQILGPEGRAKLLRSVLSTVGIEGDVVPDDDTLKAGMAAPGAAPPGSLAGGVPGAPGMLGSPAKPANTDLGVPEQTAMRGMAAG